MWKAKKKKSHPVIDLRNRPSSLVEMTIPLSCHEYLHTTVTVSHLNLYPLPWDTLPQPPLPRPRYP